MLVGSEIQWAKYGAEPRWLGQESWDCPVALEPGNLGSGGDYERKRFLAGAAERGETALLVSTIGDADENAPHNVFSNSSAWVPFPLLSASIGGPRLLAGARPSLAADLDRADRDLGLRLLNRPKDAAWWILKLTPYGIETYNESKQTEVPDGRLHPILVDDSGEPVVAAWIPAEGNSRWYILPDATDWNTVIDWLVHQALPTHAPEALRRVRHATYLDPDLQTQPEIRASKALEGLNDEFAQRKADLEEELSQAKENAEPVRNGLLYGTGDDLVAAVAHVFRDAGLTAVDLDQELSATESADLLVTDGSQRRLVEVKSAGGPASERLASFLQKHLGTWPNLRPDLPLDGGVLIVNHQHKLPPQERTATVYNHKPFTDSLSFPVISTRDIFEWWRTGDWAAVRDAVLGPIQADPAANPPDASPGSGTSPSKEQSGRPGRRLWRRDKR